MSSERFKEFVNNNFEELKNDYIEENQDDFNDYLMEEYTNYESSYGDLVYDMMKDDEFLRNYDETSKD